MGRPSLKERRAARKARTLKQQTKQRKKDATELEKLQSGKKTGLLGLDVFNRTPGRIKKLKSKLNIPDKPLNIKDHKGRDSSVGAKNRKAVRQNPASEETLKQVREKYKKKDALKTTGKGPVASGEEYGKHLKEQSKKYKTTGKGPVKDSKEYGKTVKEHTDKKAAEEKAAKVSKRKKWAKMTKAQRKASKRADMFAKAKAKRNKI